jgi:3-oxoadipate enol-lactonase
MRIEANGININYDISGKEDAPVVMLSHSLGSSSIMWDPQLPALEANYRVLRFDTRGHGGSDAPDGAYTLDMLGEDALALLDELDIDDVHWVGLSMGGMIGQNLALRAPNRLISLTLCDTTSQMPPEAQAAWAERIGIAGSQGMGALAASTMERWFTSPFLAQNPPAVATIRKQFEATPAAGFVGCCHAIRELDYIDRLPEIDMPTMIIVGAEDPSTPVAASQAMQDRIQGSRMSVIRSASHLSNVEQPEEFTGALTHFLSSVHED